MAPAGPFPDLAARFGTGAALSVVGLAAVWAGGLWFLALVLAIVAALVWELARMLGARPRRAVQLGAIAAAAMLAGRLLPVEAGLPILLLAAMAGVALLDDHRSVFLLGTALILISVYGLLVHRADYGLTWMVWLVGVVAATDIFGYFAGRLIGGPRFWPKVSPKKTWAGTVAGWIASAGVGVLAMVFTGAGAGIVGLSVALSIASQMGDIAESAMKRRMGVKDSSNLLPGHGGVLDRFDGMLGAAFVLQIVEAMTRFPPVSA